MSSSSVLGTRDRLLVSELFESIQGEGKSAGMACTFLRLAHCNLRCSWCDTKYTWDWKNYDRKKEVHSIPIKELAAKIRESRTDKLVVTGGEPLLQQEGLDELFHELRSEYILEVETNGTVVPIAALGIRVSQWNVSPKLSNSGEPIYRRLQMGAIGALLETKNAWFKFVVANAVEADEVEAICEQLCIPPERVMLMPQASTKRELSKRSLPIVQECISRGWSFSPRLHIQLWGGERGR